MTLDSAYDPIQAKLDAFEAEIKSQQDTISRFERVLIANNLLDSTSSTSSTASSAAKATTTVPKKDRYVASKTEENPQYSVTVEFSDDGSVFSEPLVNPIAGHTYQIRTLVTQHSGHDFQGFMLEWQLPTGWSWRDGNGNVTYHEFVSNPTHISRLARYNSGTYGWRVILREWYI